MTFDILPYNVIFLLKEKKVDFCSELHIPVLRIVKLFLSYVSVLKNYLMSKSYSLTDKISQAGL